jgi:hypothetical protein
MSADSQFVTCHCDACAGGIEFERALFDPDNPAIIQCPHCGIETRLYVPRADSNSSISDEGDTSASKKRKAVRFQKGQRLTLTEEQCATSLGQDLIDILLEIEEDGILTAEEIRKLNKWLDDKADSDIPAVQFLLRTSDRVVRNKKLTPTRLLEMQSAVERVLPKKIRDDVIAKKAQSIGQRASQRSHSATYSGSRRRTSTGINQS